MLHDQLEVEQGGPGPFDADHLAHMARFVPLVLGRYLAQLAWPGELSMYYRWPHVALPLSHGMLGLSAAMAVALPAGIATIAARRRDLLFFAIAPLVLLAPYTGLFYVGFWSADRYFYLAAAGPLVLAGTRSATVGGVPPGHGPRRHVRGGLRREELAAPAGLA